MDESIVRNIIEVLKTASDKTVIYKALVKLRTDLVKDREGIVVFRECGGIPPVVRLLNRPHEKILEVALSILGNCCTDNECCEEAIKNKIISPLITILKSIPNPIVQCRACRLLGNLAKDHRKEIIGSNSAAISQSVCLILEENQEIPTTMMAARATKFLLFDTSFQVEFNNCQGFMILVKTLMKYMRNTCSDYIESEQVDASNVEVKTQTTGRKMHQPREEYFKEVARHLEGVRSDIFDREILKDEKEKPKNTDFKMPTDKAVLDLLGEVLKCIQIASEIANYFPSMGRCLERDVFPCLVFCSDEHNIFRSTVLKILANFAKNPASAFLLSSADAVTTVCHLATSSNLEKPLSESELQNCLSIICMLSGDACNRAKIRRSGALQQLLERAKNYSTLKEMSMILFALNNFQYDHMSMDLLLRGGLVGILIKELDAYLNSNDSKRKESRDEKKENTRKRKSIFGCANQSAKTSKVQDEITGMDQTAGVRPHYRGAFTPPPSNTAYSTVGSCSPSSPCSSRSLSPVSFLFRSFKDCDEDEDDYSPVCSDVGDSDDDESNLDENSEIMQLLTLFNKGDGKMEENSPSDNEDEKEASKPSPTDSLPLSTIDIIDNLLLRITLSIKNHPDLSKLETIKTIIEAIYVFGANNNNFSTSLANIVVDSTFFGTIIKQNSIHSIYQMTRTADLKSCGESLIDNLTTVAESGYGQGELVKLLTKGDLFHQKRAATIVSFVVKSPKLLYQHLTEYGVIYTLLNSVLNKNDEIRLEAADAITSLANTLRIILPTYDLKQFNCRKEFEEDLDMLPCQENADTMKFVLHRGCSRIPIKFDKKLLTENSDVFNSMLNSDFKESKNKEIHLKGYSVHGIKYFLHLIKLESEKKCAVIPPVYHFDSILEAYELSRMYILENLEKNLFQLIVRRLDEKSILKVFEWSLKNYNPELTGIAINFYLSCSDISTAEKAELFREADLSTYSKEWNQMIVDAVLVRCENIQNVGAEVLMYA